MPMAYYTNIPMRLEYIKYKIPAFCTRPRSGGTKEEMNVTLNAVCEHPLLNSQFLNSPALQGGGYRLSPPGALAPNLICIIGVNTNNGGKYPSYII